MQTFGTCCAPSTRRAPTQGDSMRPASFARLFLLALASLPAAAAFGQGLGANGATPLAVDLRKVPIGSWAEYTMTIGPGAGTTMKSRWALVARNATSNTMEMA